MSSTWGGGKFLDGTLGFPADPWKRTNTGIPSGSRGWGTGIPAGSDWDSQWIQKDEAPQFPVEQDWDSHWIRGKEAQNGFPVDPCWNSQRIQRHQHQDSQRSSTGIPNGYRATGHRDSRRIRTGIPAGSRGINTAIPTGMGSRPPRSRGNSRTAPADLALLGALGPRRGPDALRRRHRVDEDEAVGDGRGRLRALPEVELHGAALAQHVRQQRPVPQGILRDPERRAQVLPVLGERQLHQLRALEVLRESRIWGKTRQVCRSYQRSSEIFSQFFMVFPDFSKFFPDFSRFFPDFLLTFPDFFQVSPHFSQIFPDFPRVFPQFSRTFLHFPSFPSIVPIFSRFCPIFSRSLTAKQPMTSFSPKLSPNSSNFPFSTFSPRPSKP